MITIRTSAKSALAEVVLSLRQSEQLIHQLIREISKAVLAHSQYIRAPHFMEIHPKDREFLFRAYDEQFFAGLLNRALDGPMTFRLSRRMTTRAGTTTKCLSVHSGEVSYQIAIGIDLLHDAFRNMDRKVSLRKSA